MSSGNSQIILNYSFIASLKKVVFSDFPVISQAGVKLITNVTDNIIIYQFNDSTKGGTVSGNALTLTYDTTSMSNSDVLMIVYEEPSAQSLESSVLEAVESINNEDIIEKLDEIKESIDTSAYPPGQKQTGSSLPVTMAYDQKPLQDTLKGATLNGLNTQLLRDDVSGYAVMGFNIKGTWVATIIFEGTFDNVNWVSLSASPAALGIPVSSTTGVGSWYLEVGAFAAVRLRVSAFTSGTIQITSRLSAIPRLATLPGNTVTVAGSVTVTCLSFTVATSNNATSSEDVASAGGGALFPSGFVRQDTPVANDNTSASGDFTWPKLSNFGATWTQPFYQTRSDTYTVTGNGTTVDTHFGALSQFSLQVTGTAATATLWDVRLEGSNDGTTFTQIVQHTNADADGLTKVSVTPFPCLYFRSRCAGLTLGGATNIVVVILGVAIG